MSSAVHSAIHLPYIKLFAFLSPLFVQALLLHPAFPSSVSTPVRLALAGPTAYLALTAPRHQGFEPRERCTGLNAVLAMVCVYASWKAIEWGTARDTTVYRWVGFDGGRRAESETASAPTLKARSNGSGGNPRRRVNKVQQRVESSTSIPSPSTTSIYSVLASTIHLCTSMRGPGYAWNDYSSRTTTPRRSPAAFLLRTLMFLLINHLAFIPLSIAIATPYSQRIDFVSTTLPSSFSPYTIHCFAESLSYTVFGLAAWTGISLGYYITTLAYFVLHSTLASLSLCGSFDSREYPPLFDRPAFPWSVKSYWGQQWHQLLRRCLVYMAWDPLVWIVGDVLGRSEAEAHAVGALGVFVLTAWAHEYGECLHSFLDWYCICASRADWLVLRLRSDHLLALRSPSRDRSHHYTRTIRLLHLLPSHVARVNARDALHSFHEGPSARSGRVRLGGGLSREHGSVSVCGVVSEGFTYALFGSLTRLTMSGQTLASRMGFHRSNGGAGNVLCTR